MMPGTGHADSATAIDGRHAILSLNLRVVLAGLPIRMAMATTVALAAAILAAPPILAQSSISPPAYALINSRTSQNQTQFYIYSDMDSGFNHGFPSGLFGNAMGKLTFTPNCVYAPTLPSGCATDPTVLDQARGTVFQFVFQSMPSGSGQFAGLNFEEPQNWGVLQQGNGYDLTGATAVEFDAISPSGGINIQINVAQKASQYFYVPSQWTSFRVTFASLGITPSDLVSAHILFGVASNADNAPNGGTVLFDNIRFDPSPAAQASAIGFPMANQVYGILHVADKLPGSILIPPDEINSNLTTTYESSLVLEALLLRGQAQDLANAKLIADAFVYALGHDNQGDPLPVATDGSKGLHNGMFSGDLPLYNSQGTGAGQAGQVRLSGFTASTLCPATGFCLVLDGATGGNNAFAIMALLAAYTHFQDPAYLNSALTIGNWIYDQLWDSSGTGYGGYFVGYPDEGAAKVLQLGKSTENNADIFAAFTALANAVGDPSASTMWTNRANIAGDFVMQMFEPATGHFFAGTSPVGASAGPGINPNGAAKGNDVINTFDFLDAQTFTTLAMAGSVRYQPQIDWRRPLQWTLSAYPSTVVAGGLTFQGFDLIEPSEHQPNDVPGVAWEFTGQVAASMELLSSLYSSCPVCPNASFYLGQLRQAQTSAPFADGNGVVAATLANGQAIVPYQQCLVTPFQCIAERVGLAATSWAIFASEGFSPLSIPQAGAGISAPATGASLSSTSATFSWNPVAGAAGYLVQVGTTPGGSDIFSGVVTSLLEIDHLLPCDGSTIFLRVSAEINGIFTDPVTSSYTSVTGCGRFGPGDFNGDGHPDLLWQSNANGQVTVHYYGGIGGSTYRGWSWIDLQGPSGWKLVGSADFDNDGVPDLVWMNLATRQVTVNYYSKSGSGYQLKGWAYLNRSGAPGWSVVAVADFDGNGVPDLVWQNDSTHQVTVDYYGGSGGAKLVGWSWLNSAGVPGWTVAGAGDFDGNGTPDLVWMNTQTRQVTVHYYGGPGGAVYSGWKWLNQSGAHGWTVAGANDLDGNGVPDLVWMNDATHQVTVNYYGGASGAVLSGWNWIDQNGVPGWTLIVPR